MSQPAREIGISRPLLHTHPQKLVVAGHLELSVAGKATKHFEVTGFDVRLTAATLAAATLSGKEQT